VVTSEDPELRDVVSRELFNYLYTQYVDVPLFEVKTQLAYNPKTVMGWQFPGVTSAGYGHWNMVRAAE
jgi:hypothetical protein